MNEDNRVAVFVESVVINEGDCDSALRLSPPVPRSPQTQERFETCFIDGEWPHLEGSVVILRPTTKMVRNMYGWYYWEVVNEESND